MRQRDKKSYPQFEGRIIAWTNSRYKKGQVFFVKVIGCDYNVGYTLVNALDPTQNLTCVNGPSSKDYKKYFDSDEQYDNCFAYFLDVMRNNKEYSADEVRTVMNRQPSVFASMATCAFQ